MAKVFPYKGEPKIEMPSTGEGEGKLKRNVEMPSQVYKRELKVLPQRGRRKPEVLPPYGKRT